MTDSGDETLSSYVTASIENADQLVAAGPTCHDGVFFAKNRRGPTWAPNFR